MLSRCTVTEIPLPGDFCWRQKRKGMCLGKQHSCLQDAAQQYAVETCRVHYSSWATKTVSIPSQQDALVYIWALHCSQCSRNSELKESTQWKDSASFEGRLVQGRGTDIELEREAVKANGKLYKPCSSITQCTQGLSITNSIPAASMTVAFFLESSNFQNNAKIKEEWSYIYCILKDVFQHNK